MHEQATQIANAAAVTIKLRLTGAISRVDMSFRFDPANDSVAAVRVAQRADAIGE